MSHGSSPSLMTQSLQKSITSVADIWKLPICDGGRRRERERERERQRNQTIEKSDSKRCAARCEIRVVHFVTAELLARAIEKS
jgi:outer membrane protein TolC